MIFGGDDFNERSNKVVVSSSSGNHARRSHHTQIPVRETVSDELNALVGDFLRDGIESRLPNDVGRGSKGVERINPIGKSLRVQICHS